MQRLLLDYTSPNINNTFSLGNGTFTFPTSVAQAFHGLGLISEARFSISATGSPPALTAWADIYAHTGTFGTTSAPTGSSLATSEVVNLGIFGITSADRKWVRFPFAVPFNTVVGTDYCIAITVANGGDASNFYNVPQNNANPDFAGNYASRDTTAGTWSAAGSSRDTQVQLYGPGLVFHSGDNSIRPAQFRPGIAR